MDKKTLLNLNKKDLSILKKELVNLQQELFNLRIQKKMNQGLQNNNLLKEARKNIARIKNLINKKVSSNND
ncbi:MAG: 50S ribosomal protein L29 [Candidatus Dasytiphilus stammeri]